VSDKDLNHWLQMLFGLFNRKLTSEMREAYTIGLDDLTPEKLKLAFSETIRRHPTDFLPMPGQIRGYLEAAIEKLPARPSDADPNCSECGGSAYRTVDREDGDGQHAVLCECVKRNRAARGSLS